MTRRLISLAALIALAIPLSFTPAGQAGALRGPSLHADLVLARDTDVYRVAFRGGRAAEVIVRGDGDSDLDVFVYDEDGNLVAFDDGPTDTCLVTWVPRRTQVFTIKVKNLGVPNRYTIRTN